MSFGKANNLEYTPIGKPVKPKSKDSKALSIKALLSEKKPDSIAVIVGCEGGFSPEEIEEKLMNKVPYIKEVLVYQEGDKITGEFFLNVEDYPDARDNLDADVKKVNATMPAFKRVTKIVVRDEEFPKTTTMKIARKYHTN